MRASLTRSTKFTRSVQNLFLHYLQFISVQVVFQLTVRAGACREIAEDEKEFDRMRDLFMICETTTDAKTVLMKWWPSRALKIKQNATKDLTSMFQKVLTNRRATGRREDDAMQALIDEGCSDSDIMQFIITTLFAGQSDFPFSSCASTLS